MIYVKPAPGATIGQPNRNWRNMPVEGDYVDENNSYYARLLVTGDVVLAEPPGAESRVADTEQASPPTPAPPPPSLAGGGEDAAHDKPARGARAKNAQNPT